MADLGPWGHLHKLSDNIDLTKYTPKERKVITNDEWQQLQRTFENAVSSYPDIGLRIPTMQNYGIGWNPEGGYWTWPIYNASGEICGMSTRYRDGFKACVSGTTAGVFLPRKKPTRRVWAVAEGATDSATVYELGVSCLGKFNWETPHDIVSDIINNRIKPDVVIIVADNDAHGVGLQGAVRLKPRIKCRCEIMTMPDGIKDIRQFYRGGLTREKFKEAIERLLK